MFVSKKNILEILKKGKIFILFSLFCFKNSYSNELIIQKIETEKIYHEAQWLKLLKYRNSILSSSGYKSEAMTSSFFLSANGKFDPKDEIIKNVLSFFYPQTIEDEKKICHFPARYLYLSKRLNLPRKNLLIYCKDFSEFYRKISIKSAYVVFSSYFVNNPASAFGHTFLRFGKSPEDDSSGYDLLDYAVNNGAIVTTNNALFYSIYGLMGWFHGEFLIMPYFYKVREYNDFESRDLFSYQLNFNQEELDFLVAHSWEMGQTSFRYYYLDENCSYQIISLIDAIKPEWKLIENLNVTVIPIDTIKLLFSKPNAVRKVSYRASLESKFKKKVMKLNDIELKELKYFIRHEEMSSNVTNFTDESQAKIYDAAIDYYDKTYPNEILLKNEKKEALKKDQLLKARSHIQALPLKDDFTKEENNPPHHSHDSKTFAVSLGLMGNRDLFHEIDFRNSFHDIMDDQSGFPPKMTLIMGQYKGRFFYQVPKGENKKDYFLYSPKMHLSLEEFTVFKILSLNPIGEFSKSPSFKVRLSSNRIKSGRFKNHFKGFVEAGGGYSASFLDESLYLYIFINEDLGYVSDNSNAPILFALGPELGTYFFSEDGNWRGHLSMQWYRYFFKNKEDLFLGQGELRYQVVKNQEVSLNYGLSDSENELSFKYYYFF